MRFVAMSVLLIVALAFTVGANEVRTEYQMNVGDYYEVSYEDIQAVVDLGITGEELPVVFKIATTANVDAAKIASARLSGKSWMSIASDYDLTAGSFYMMVTGEIKSRAYIPVFTKFRVTPESQWKLINLTDDELVRLVNLRFISSHYDYSPYKVMSYRDKFANFVRIGREVAVAKSDLIEKQRVEAAQKKTTTNN